MFQVAETGATAAGIARALTRSIMNGYVVELRLVAKSSTGVFARAHGIPPLLEQLGAFVGTQPAGSIGRFEGLVSERIADVSSQEHATRMGKFGFSFMPLASGAHLAVFAIRGADPVVLLDTEGEARVIAPSLAAFVLDWAKGKTGIADLDEHTSDALVAWVTDQKLDVPEHDFDFGHWLDHPPE